MEVGPPATMNARYNHNYLPDGDMMSFALHKIKRKIGVSSRSVCFGILFVSFFKVIVLCCVCVLQSAIKINWNALNNFRYRY